MRNYLMIIAVGEKDNNGYSTEFFRVIKGIELDIPPQLNTFIEYEEDEHFYIDTIEQAPKFGQIYLYQTIFKSRYEYNGDKKEYDKLEKKYLEKGWSKTHGGFKLMSRKIEEWGK